MPLDIVGDLDKAVARALREPPRGHLGASQIGDICLRQAWYGFRWAYLVKHKGRVLRLFNRGHEEEFRFVRWLREAGYGVRDYSERLLYSNAGDGHYDSVPWEIDWQDDIMLFELGFEDVHTIRAHIELATEAKQMPPQWGFVDHRGHFAGSSDGKLRFPQRLINLGAPEGWGGCEFKTHNDKSFKLLQNKGVLSSKQVHWVQMQIYMDYLDLPWMLYLAVNKNDDELYPEIVYAKPEVAAQYRDIALKVIEAPTAPKRVTNDPAWWQCKFCDYREVCHYDALPQKNCRSCVFARPGDDARWHCGKFHMDIPDGFIPQGCDDWEPIE